MAEICDNFAVSRAVSGIGLQFAINHIKRPKGRADRRPDEGTGKTPGTGTAKARRNPETDAATDATTGRRSETFLETI